MRDGKLRLNNKPQEELNKEVYYLGLEGSTWHA